MENTIVNAEWRKLVMVNYTLDKNLLLPYLPKGTEIDLWQGKCFVSLIGFMFMNTKVLGAKIPFHINFEEINLRFYVRVENMGNWKKGVVFIKESISKPLVALTANTLYNEKYEVMPTDHTWEERDNSLFLQYSWEKERSHDITVLVEKELRPIGDNSEELFLSQRPYGYTKISEEETLEYQVNHPRWLLYPVKEYTLNVDFAEIFGSRFSFLSQKEPASVLVCEGSEIEIMTGTPL